MRFNPKTAQFILGCWGHNLIELIWPIKVKLSSTRKWEPSGKASMEPSIFCKVSVTKSVYLPPLSNSTVPEATEYESEPEAVSLRQWKGGGVIITPPAADWPLRNIPQNTHNKSTSESNRGRWGTTGHNTRNFLNSSCQLLTLVVVTAATPAWLKS